MRLRFAAIGSWRVGIRRMIEPVELCYSRRPSSCSPHWTEQSMETLGKILVAVVALEHFYILVLEMFLWTTPRGMKAFGTTPEIAQSSKTLAANQGLYNGFLAVGLVWSLIHPDPLVGRQIALFFLGCVI